LLATTERKTTKFGVGGPLGNFQLVQHFGQIADEQRPMASVSNFVQRLNSGVPFCREQWLSA
jgi:hypothetical protein